MAVQNDTRVHGLRLKPQRRGSLGMISVKIFHGCQRMAKVPYGVETLPKISTGLAGCMSVTDDRQTTDGRAIAYSEREHEFTFAKNVRK